MDKKKIERYVKQEWFSEADVISSLPFYPTEVVRAFSNGKIKYICRFRFRKKGEKNIEACYGLNWANNKDGDSSEVKDAINAMLIYAQDNFGFNWEDFEVRNIKTGVFENGEEK